MSYDTSGPAFPQPMIETDRGLFPSSDWGNGGMTIRQWYAGLAMVGLCLKAAPDYSIGACDNAIVKRAFALADAMLAEGAKEKDHAS